MTPIFFIQNSGISLLDYFVHHFSINLFQALGKGLEKGRLPCFLLDWKVDYKHVTSNGLLDVESDHWSYSSVYKPILVQKEFCGCILVLKCWNLCAIVFALDVIEKPVRPFKWNSPRYLISASPFIPPFHLPAEMMRNTVDEKREIQLIKREIQLIK